MTKRGSIILSGYHEKCTFVNNVHTNIRKSRLDKSLLRLIFCFALPTLAAME